MNDTTQTSGEPAMEDHRTNPGQRLALPKIEYVTDDLAERLAAVGNWVAIQDTREQRPLDLSMPTVRRRLETGDYSLVGYEDLIVVERKSPEDLVQCCGRDRARFQQCVDRLLKIPYRCVVVEGDWQAIKQASSQGRVSATCVENSVISWMVRGLPFLFAPSRWKAAEFARQFLERSARWHERKVSIKQEREQNETIP